jgi:hypothetical protein
MDLEKLSRELDSSPVNSQIYSLFMPIERRFCLNKKDEFWHFFFRKRNKKIFKFFKSEIDACIFFKQLMKIMLLIKKL